MSVWDEDAAPPVEPTTETTEQPANTETEQPVTSPAEKTEVESPSAGEEAATQEAVEAEGQDEEVREDVALADIDTRFSNSPKGARAYISKLTQRLEDAKDAVSFQQKYLAAVPADELLTDLETKSKSRHSDLGWAYYNNYKHAFVENDPKLGLPYDELVALVESRKGTTDAPPRDTATATTSSADEITTEDITDLPDWAQEPVKRMLAEQGKSKQLETELAQIKERLSRFETDQQTATQTAEQQEQEAIQNDFFSQVHGHAKEYIAENLGLKVLDGDPPNVKRYIEKVTQEMADRLFDEFAKREQFKADGDAVEDAVNRRDKSRVNSYVPKAKVAAEIVLDELAEVHKDAVKAMRSPAKQETPKRPEVNGQSTASPPPNTLPRGQGVDAVWDART